MNFLDKVFGETIGTDEFGNAISQISWTKVVASVIVIFITALLLIVAQLNRKRYVKKGNKGQAATVTRVIFGIIEIAIVVIGILFLLHVLGINISAAVAGLGIVSATVALALQDILKDVIMGIHILTDKFYAVGDGVVYNEKEGIIKEFSLMTTRIQLIADNSVISVCNRNISEIRKLSDMVDLDIPLSYEEDPRKIHEAFKEIAKEIGKIPKVEKSEYKGTQDFDSSAVIYKLRYYCHPKNRAEIHRGAVKIVQEKFIEKGISIPYNQLDVHIDK